MPLNRFALLAFLTIAGCTVDRSGLAYPCEVYLADDAALHTDGAIPGWCLDRLQDGAALVDADMHLLDAGPEEDGGDAGDAADAEMPDAGPEDADVDAGTDAGSDAGPEDGGPPDSGPPDAGPRDAGPPDGGPVDAGTDAGPSPIGCASGTVNQAYPGDMVGCDGALDQCTAETLCGSGWHLCTYSEYAARGGDAVTATTLRWIASCVRATDCSLAGSPTNATCGSCTRTGGSPVTVGRTCAGGSDLSDTDCPLGVTAGTASMGYRLLSESLCTRTSISSTRGAFGATCCR